MVKAFLGIVLAICLCACSSTRHVDRQILEYQRQIDRLEEELRARDRAITECISEIRAVTERSREMESGVDTIIQELDEYQRAVQHLLDGVDQTPSAD